MRNSMVHFFNTGSQGVRPLIAAALPIAALALIVIGTHLTSTHGASAQGEASMRLNVTSGGQCDGDRCTVPLGGNFTLTVVIEQAPPEGYILAQSFIDFGRRLTYNMTDEPVAEILWPDCVSAVAVRAQFPPETVNHGCLTGLIPPLPLSTYIGPFAEVSLTCSSEPSTTMIRLLPYDDVIASTSGSLFVPEDGVTKVIVPVRTLALNCGQGSTLEPTYTPLAPNGQQPASTSDPGAPGGVVPTLDEDAQATADAAATPTPTDDGTPGDARNEDDEEAEDDNGGGNTVLIIVIIAVALALAAGGGGYYLWRQRVAQGGPPGEGSQ